MNAIKCNDECDEILEKYMDIFNRCNIYMGQNLQDGKKVL